MSSTKYLVDRQQCKGEQVLHLHGNTEHFDTVDSHTYAIKNINGMSCCVSMANVVTRMRHNVTCYVRVQLSTLLFHNFNKKNLTVQLSYIDQI
jgi:hypothetical protein